MNSGFKKVISFILAFIIVISSVPKELVLANYQNPVRDLSIRDTTSVNAVNYTFELRWSNPTISNKTDTLAVNGGDPHEPKGYRIYYRNTSKSEQYGPHRYDVAYNNANPVAGRMFYDYELESGSIYMFKVTPWHTHEYRLQNSTVDYRDAPMDSPDAEGQEALYLTDIKVDATGSGSQLTVEWDNPTLDGRDVFTGYRIYYTLGGAEATIQPNPSFDVSLNDPDLVRKPDGRLQYVINDQSLQIGSFYAIKVEPLINNSLARTQNRITVNSKTYNFSYPSMAKEYRTNSGYISPSLYIEAYGPNAIRLFWDSLSNSIRTVDRVEVYESFDENFTTTNMIGLLSGNDARYINFLQTEKPQFITYYRIIIYFRDINGDIQEMKSEYVVFDPIFNDFTPYSPTILNTADNGAIPLNLDITWEAFLRQPYTEAEKNDLHPVYNKFLDKDVEYKVWITDDISNFNNGMFISQPIAVFGGFSLDVVDSKGIDGTPKLGYVRSFTEYTTILEDGTISRKALEDNKVYYIRIIATRPTGQVSSEAIGSHYIAPTGDISTIPNMMTTPPLRIKKDENGIDVITDDSITIQWDIRWFEAYNANTKNWYVKIGISDSGTIVFGDLTDQMSNVLHLNDDIYTNGTTDEGIARIKRDLLSKGATQSEIDKLPLRLIDLKNADYEIHTVLYDHMQQAGTIDAYLSSLINSNDEWHKITGTGDPLHPEFKVTNENQPEPGNLKSNTPYVIFFRPYIVKDEKRAAYYPAFIVATTLTIRGPIEVKPTVPILIPVAETDTSLTVKWEYTEGLEYELSYSDLPGDYPEGGNKISSEDIKNDSKIESENGKLFLYYTIKNLFPETTYYIWIRSAYREGTTSEYSSWSNRIIMNTLEIQKPRAPRGLGLGSIDNVRTYNVENKTDYLPVDVNYMTIEWMRDFNDTVVHESLDGDVSNGNEILFSPSFLGTYMVKFNNLVANRSYFVRAKTVLTVRRASDGIVREYNYVVQIADTNSFRDAIQITVPSMTNNPGTGSNDFRRKESDWSNTVILKTERWGGEYDGDKNPDLYPLPKDDFEITYNRTTQTLNYRFRTNKIDANGNRDNNVDQRFISRLIESKTFVFDVDLSRYDNQVIVNRVLEIPYSIISAFEKDKIALKIKANNLEATLLPGSFNTGEVRNISGFGMNSSVIISLTESKVNLPVIPINDSYVSAPQSIDIRIVTNSASISLSQLEDNSLTIDMLLDNRYSLLDTNVGTYVSTRNDTSWQRVPNNYDNGRAAVSFNTNKLGSYSVIQKNLPFNNAASNNLNDLYTVFTKFEITDLGSYNPNNEVSAAQINNIIAAIATDKMSTAINTAISNEDYNSLGKANILVSGMMAARDASINALVRLYEIKTKTSVRNYPTITNSRFSDINSVDPRYQDAILKAEHLGLINTNTVNPKANITFGEVFEILAIIIEDAGL